MHTAYTDTTIHTPTARTLQHIVKVAHVHIDATITVTRLPWRSKTFENIFTDPKLADLCAASVSNICTFIISTHRLLLVKLVRHIQYIPAIS